LRIEFSGFLCRLGGLVEVTLFIKGQGEIMIKTIVSGRLLGQGLIDFPGPGRLAGKE